MKILAAIFNFLSGGVLDKVFDHLAARDAAKLAAMNDAEKRAFDERQDVRQTAKEIRLATASFWEMRLITFLIAATFTLHLVLVGLDTCFGFGWRVPKFPPPFDEWEGIILLSFFGVQVAGNVTRTVAATTIVKARTRLTGGLFGRKS